MRIGIIGGGQLGMMMAEAAQTLGHTVVGLDPTPHCPLSHVADQMICANYDNHEALERLVLETDVVTYEFENVDLVLVDRHRDKIPQKSAGLRFAKHRIEEKNLARSLGIPTPKYQKLRSISNIVPPCIIKTTTGGYDGKGQTLIRFGSEIDQFRLEPTFEYIMEEYITFDYEISVIATRDLHGRIVTFPIPINTHRNGILFTSDTSHEIPKNITQNAIQYTTALVKKLDYVGTLAVEYFVRGDEVLFNEYAPRPHNSGHYTIEGCNVSQFENHIRAITGMELIVPRLLHPAVMINVLGQDEGFYDRADKSICTIHDYRKQPSLPNRKMGHITCTSEDMKGLSNIIQYIIGGA